MQSHPQRTGRSLFLPWILGLVAQAVLMRGVSLTLAPVGSGWNRHGAGVFVAVAVLAHGWQAWLLFRPGWRFALWTALPLMGLAAPGNYQWIQLQGVIAPVLETVALARVRQRPWAWLLAGMGQVILSAAGGAVVNGFFHSVGSRILTPTLAGSLLLSGAMSGLWLLGEAAAAYVLAFWMPPTPQRPPGAV